MTAPRSTPPPPRSVGAEARGEWAVEDLSGALAAARGQRVGRLGLPGKLQYWVPGGGPADGFDGAARGDDDAARGDDDAARMGPDSTGGPGRSTLPELSAIKPRPMVSVEAREKPAEDVVPEPPRAQYRVLVRSNADLKETEAFEAYFVEHLGLGCYLEEDGSASGGESLFRVFLDRKFVSVREASEFCREVKDMARAQPFRSGSYFLDALPLKGNW